MQRSTCSGLLATSLCVALAACGGDGGGPLSPGVGDDVGGGTQTLSIDADLNAEAIVSNSTDPSQYTTSFSVRLTKAGAAVTAGTVTVTSLGGSVDLVYDPARDNGRWVGQQNGYHEAYQVDVESGTDTIDGVVVDGPDLHTITSPTPGATVDATMPLVVAWSSDEPADSATIETKETDPVTIPDSGTYSLPAGALKSKPDQTETEELELRRFDVVVPAGAVAGSTVRVRIRNRIDLVVMPTGA
ncbi:MAG: hypothetical protein KA297_09510 [Kofleriaceae bacterium]|nr:hypothetical protein [Kofleriaceae bacterium]MBP6841231.1 hypothetical protein [Kofleriaceae bacterium]